MTLEDLGRRAVACKHWRFLPGTRIVGHNTMGRPMSLRLLNIPGSAWPEFWVAETRNANEVSFMKGVEEAGFLPDLSDPATLGCLLHLVREATGEHSSASWYPGGKHDYPHWAWYSDDCYGKLCEGATEAECLVKVLEAAP